MHSGISIFWIFLKDCIWVKNILFQRFLREKIIKQQLFYFYICFIFCRYTNKELIFYIIFTLIVALVLNSIELVPSILKLKRSDSCFLKSSKIFKKLV